MINQDIIFIRELTIDTVIGVYEWEKAIKQKLVLDLDIYTDIKPAADSDDITETLDYKNLSDKIINFIKENNFNLIETVAEEIASLILEEDMVSKVKISVNKPKAIKEAKTVGVCIERTK